MKLLILWMPAWLKGRLKKIQEKYNFWHFRLTQKAPLPSQAIIDPCNLCNLHCALCPTGRGVLSCRQMFMSPETFRRVLEEIPTLRHISLFNWGEPFLSPHIFEIIRMAKERKIIVSIHSNFSFLQDKSFFENIVQSGLDSLEISLDGGSQETYEKYRNGGDFNLVLENIKKLLEAKASQKANNPQIIWKFIVNKYNEKDLPEAKKMAEELGVNFMVSKIGLADNLPDAIFPESLEERRNWLPKEEKCIREEYQGAYHLPLNDRICDFLFTSVTIGPDGKIYPCCFVTDEKSSLGDITRESFQAVWNNEKFTSARNLFLKNSQQKNGPLTVCNSCQNYKKAV